MDGAEDLVDLALSQRVELGAWFGADVLTLGDWSALLSVTIAPRRSPCGASPYS